MNWLDEKLYSTEEEQENWSQENWLELWAQIVHVINYILVGVTKENIKQCSNIKERHSMEIMYKKKSYYSKEVSSWNVNKITYKLKAILKAELIQRHSYYQTIKQFTNLAGLNDVDRLQKPFYLNREQKFKPFKWYNMNIWI